MEKIENKDKTKESAEVGERLFNCEESNKEFKRLNDKIFEITERQKRLSLDLTEELQKVGDEMRALLEKGQVNEE